jgi:hypothetical protein
MKVSNVGQIRLSNAKGCPSLIHGCHCQRSGLRSFCEKRFRQSLSTQRNLQTTGAAWSQQRSRWRSQIAAILGRHLSMPAAARRRRITYTPYEKRFMDFGSLRAPDRLETRLGVARCSFNKGRATCQTLLIAFI